ncbi:MAG: GtrA family protein [Acidimicrobiales bacterium]
MPVNQEGPAEAPATPRTLRSVIDDLRQRQGVRYIIVGGSTYVLELAMILVCTSLGAGPVLAVAISFWFGLLVSFILQKFLAFGDRRTHHRVVIAQIVSFSALVGFNFGFTVALTDLLQHDLPVVVIRTIAIGITTIWNYYLYKTRIFRVPIVD